MEIFDPNGDVLLILSYADTDTLRETQSPVSGPDVHESMPRPQGKIAAQPKESSSSGEGTPPRMLVSSRHLMLVSVVFEKMLSTSNFAEGAMLHQTQKVEVHLPEDDHTALTIMMNVIHGQTRKVPQKINFGVLIAIAILVDKYQMAGAVEFMAHVWMDKLKPSKFKNDNSLLPWLFVSWVFRHDEYFRNTTMVLVKEGDSNLKSRAMNCVPRLPIPGRVIAAILETRVKFIAAVLSAIEATIERHKNPIAVCNRNRYVEPQASNARTACNDMVLGSLIRSAMLAQLWPAPRSPYKGRNFVDIVAQVENFQINSLCEQVGNRDDPKTRNTHGVKERLKTSSTSTRDNFHGLGLNEFMK
ncbi:hypothetical protein BP6252_12397 [Coleophoma cylindrospora]|uniref:BTB domain-containing protein n=1 Tax=Coleophoma cylindrospora TaxID=1849047 RepID=A0A3D8QHX6_9HELO|nr:hypothetical protein BP6252_12397 [Coleophoma cylindrospora]